MPNVSPSKRVQKIGVTPREFDWPHANIAAFEETRFTERARSPCGNQCSSRPIFTALAGGTPRRTIGAEDAAIS